MTTSTRGKLLPDLRSRNELTCALFLDVDFEAEPPGIRVRREPTGLAQLVVCRGLLAGRRFALTDQPATLGRAPESGIRLDDFTVSRRHAHLAPVPEGYLIRDLGSLNGTYVDRERVEDRVLEDGDEVRIGGFLLVFRAASPGWPTRNRRRPGFGRRAR